MKPISYKRHRFPLDTIRLAVWLHFRFTPSLRDVEEMLAERGIEVTYEGAVSWMRTRLWYCTRDDITTGAVALAKPDEPIAPRPL